MKTKKTTLKAGFGKMALLLLSLFLSGAARSQCDANFSSTANPSGVVNFRSLASSSFFKLHSWNFGDGATVNFTYPGANRTINHTYAGPGTYVVLHRIKDSTGTGCDTTYRQTITVGTGPMPCMVNASFNPVHGAGNLVSFTSLSSTAPYNLHSWDFGDGTVVNFSGIGVNSFINHTYATPGVYNVTHRMRDSIGTCDTSSIQNVTITGPPCPASVSFVAYKDSLAPLKWSVYPTYPSNALSILWSWGDGSYNSGSYPSHTYSVAGVYNICVSVYTTCGDTSVYCLPTNIYRSAGGASSDMISVDVLNLTSSPTAIKTNGNGALVEASLYPNPSKDNAILNISSATGSTYKMNIYNSDGRLLVSETIDTEAGSTNTEIKTGYLQTGLYFISLTNGKEHKTLKLIKE